MVFRLGAVVVLWRVGVGFNVVLALKAWLFPSVLVVEGPSVMALSVVNAICSPNLVTGRMDWPVIKLALGSLILLCVAWLSPSISGDVVPVDISGVSVASCELVLGFFRFGGAGESLM